MQGITIQFSRILWAALASGATAFALEEAAVAPAPTEIVISVADQRLALLKDGALVKKFPISTSKFGLGDSWGSYKTPVGHHRIYEKIGEDLALGAVLKRRHATGEILPVNAPGRDPIVTRILWLEGLEAQNSNAKSRGIYIHGTVEEDRLGEPVSYGCIRMRSRDVMELFDETPAGTPVNIVAGKLPRLRKPAPAPAQPEVILASNERVTPVIGPKGVVMLRTTRSSDSTDAEKAAASSPRVLFAAKSEATKPQALSSAKVAPMAKATVTHSEPVGALRTSAPASPLRRAFSPANAANANADRSVVQAMTGSIMHSDLPEVPAPTPQAPAQPVAGENPEPTALQIALFVDLGAPDLLLELLDQRRRELPLDTLSKHLLHPPAPQFRLAFRTTVPAARERLGMALLPQ